MLTPEPHTQTTREAVNILQKRGVTYGNVFLDPHSAMKRSRYRRPHSVPSHYGCIDQNLVWGGGLVGPSTGEAASFKAAELQALTRYLLKQK